MLLCPLATPQHHTVTVLLPTIFTTPLDNQYDWEKVPGKQGEPLHGIRENWRSQLSVSSIVTTEGFCHERSTECSNRMAAGLARSGTSWVMHPAKGSCCGKLCGMATAHTHITGQINITPGFCPSVISGLGSLPKLGEKNITENGHEESARKTNSATVRESAWAG